MKIYLARHGQTDWNKEMRAQGRSDVPLNEAGREQARELRDKIKDLEFDAVYASPLKRAAETAEIAVDGRYTIKHDDRIAERSFGDFEGQVVKSWADLVGGDGNIDDYDLDQVAGNVEPVKSMLARVEDFLTYLRKEYPDNAQILVVAHGAISKAFDWLLSQHEEGAQFSQAPHLGNAELREYEF